MDNYSLNVEKKSYYAKRQRSTFISLLVRYLVFGFQNPCQVKAHSRGSESGGSGTTGFLRP